MNWYVAKIVYQIISGQGSHTPQFDEQLRLVQADAMSDAKQKVVHLGHREESSFLNAQNELVQWKFIDVADLRPLNHLEDGMEIYSYINELEDAGSYISLIHEKASQY